MPPQRSEVWKHFKLSDDKKTASCQLCDATLSYLGTTSNLKNHLKGKHPTFSDVGTSKQSPINLFLKKKTPTDNEKIVGAITNMIVKDYMPLSTMNSDAFKELISAFDPEFKVPSRNTIRSRIIKRYSDEREQLVNELKDVQSVSITTDTWTSNATDSYITVTEHHIDNEWKMKSNVLLTRRMPERHTADNIASRLQECVTEFSLDGKVHVCVHDNARNMDAAGALCEDWEDLGCFAHTLQLCVKPALEIQTVSNIVSKCRKLVGHFKHSTTVTSEMRKRQELLGEKKHELIQDVPTRWNSTQLMLERVSEQRRVIMDIMLDGKLTKKNDMNLLPKNHEWDIISDLSSVLSTLTNVTTYMCSDQQVSCSEIYPIVNGLISGPLKCTDSDSGLVQKVKDSVSGELKRRFRPSDWDSCKKSPILASLLDPRYKQLSFMSSEQRTVARETLENKLDEIPLRVRSTTEESNETPSKRRRLDFMEFKSPERTDYDEVSLYFAQKRNSDTDPLQWWKEHEGQFPRIAKVARKVLSVPATSVPSERVFSSAGLIVNKPRNRLSGDIVDSIIFLNKNKISANYGDDM